MKKIAFSVFIVFGLILLPVFIFAQSPQAFKYQGVARDVSGVPVINQTIGLKLSIIEYVLLIPFTRYSETHTVTTNDVGVFSVNIGQGTVLSGTFTSLTWRTVQYKLKVELDITGGSTYVSMGISPILSVPYALYAASGGDAYTAGAGISISGSNVISASDASPTNEIQTLSLAGSNLTISGGNSVALPSGLPAGVTGNTLRHDGSSWIANNLLYNDGTNLGIGTTNPAAKLTLNNGSLLATGSTGETPVSGNGVRMMWIPAKRAFRAGMVSGSHWDNDSLGAYSVAFGYNTKALSSYSSAFGNNTTASGNTAMAVGYNSVASGNYSLAASHSTEATGTYSTAFGYLSKAQGISAFTAGSNNISTGNYSFTAGYSNETTQDYGFAAGNNNLASGSAAFATGASTEASGNNSSSFGYLTKASGANSAAFGYSSSATGNQSAAFGFGSTSQAYGSLVIGRNNVVGGTSDTWVTSDPLFVAGNGSSSSSRSNAFTVLKDGRTGIGIANPTYMLEVQNPDFSRSGYFNNLYAGASTKYGLYNILSEDGTYHRYGIYNMVWANSTGSNASYGIYNSVNPNSGSGNVYGLYTTIASTGTGNRYGIYVSAEGGWAGYFAGGDIYVADAVAINTATIASGYELAVAGDGYFTNTLAVGSSTIPTGYKLAVDGKLICEEVKVQLSTAWPDYVFDHSYHLLPLSELEKSIIVNHRLPDMPSSDEVKEDGLDLGDMTSKLTEKIEELTLYLIELNRKVEDLQNENEWLKKQMTGK